MTSGSEQVEPMTAAEYREMTKTLDVTPVRRTLAALEERERLLGRVAELEGTIRSWQPSADAALGALVRRIREHEMVISSWIQMRVGPGDHGYTTGLTVDTLTKALSHLDSLLPKEPEVVTGPSGWSYQRDFGTNVKITCKGQTISIASGYSAAIPPCDAPVVAALMAGGGK